MDIEPMELDFDYDSGNRKNNHVNRSLSWAYSPECERETPTNISDMDVDQGSPSPMKDTVQSSTSWEQIRRALLSISPAANPTANSVKDEAFFDSDISDKSLTVRDNWSKTWEPAATAVQGVVAFRKRKSGYGIPDDEKTFAHFPQKNPYLGGDKQLHRRQRPNSAQEQKSKVKAVKPNLNAESDGKVSRSGEKGFANENVVSKGKSCCNIFCNLLIFMLILAACLCAILYMIDQRKRQCEQSRSFDQRVLEMDLESKLYGQHIVSSLVPSEIDKYFRLMHLSSDSDREVMQQDTPSLCQPLVMSFHGWTGVGKNFVSTIVSDLFHYSRVSHFNIPFHFPHKELQGIYRQQIQQWIVSNFTTCVVNVFVIDEMDKAYPEVVEGIAEVLRGLAQPCSTASPVIFLLLSNSKAVEINQAFLQFLQESSENKRDQLSLEHFIPIFEENSDLWYSKLVQDDLLHIFIPFLPLEKDHVIQCIKRDLVSKRFSTDADTVDHVLNELSFTRVGNLELSTTGCKRVADKVDYIMYEKHK